VASALVLAAAWLIHRQNWTASLLEGWTPVLLVVGVFLVGFIALRWQAGRWLARVWAPTLQSIGALGRGAPPETPLTVDLKVDLLGESWLGPGDFALLAGARRLPADGAVDELRAAGLDVWAVGLPELRLTSHRRPGGVRRVSGAVSDGSLRAWAAEVRARGRAAAIVIDPVAGLDDYWPAERVESRLGRLHAALAPELAEGLRVLVLWDTEPEWVLSRDPIVQRGLAGVTVLRVWDGRRAVSVSGRAGEGALEALAAWLVRPRATEAWRPGLQRVASIASTGAAAALYLLGAVLVCGAVFLGEATEQRLIGDLDGSLVGSLWSNWWVGHALADGALWRGEIGQIFSSDSVYWPTGASLIELFGNVLPSLLAQPLQWLLGYPDYWNVFVLLSVTANGLAMWSLARQLGADRGGALVAGAVFAYAPPLILEVGLGHQAVFQAFALPMALRASLRAIDGGRRGDAVMAAIWLGAASLGWWVYGAVAWALALALGWSRWRRSARDRRRALLGTLGRVVQVYLPVLLFAGPLLALANSDSLPGLWSGVFPHELEGDMLGDVMVGTLVDRSLRPASMLLGEPGQPLGWAPWVLAGGIAFLWRASPFRRRWFWPITALVAIVLAIGPYIQPAAGGEYDWMPMPGAALFYAFPFYSRLHQPDRMLVFVFLAVAAMVGLLFGWLLRLARREDALMPALVGWSLAVCMPFLDGAAPVSVTTFDVPEYYEVLGEEGAIIEVPIGFREEMLLYQPYHEHPVLGGPGEKWRAAMASGDFHLQLRLDPFLYFLWDQGAPLPQAGSFGDIRDRGFRYVMVHEGWLRRLAAKRMDRRVQSILDHLERIDGLLGPAIFTSSEVSIYRIADVDEATENVQRLKQAMHASGSGPVMEEGAVEGGITAAAGASTGQLMTGSPTSTQSGGPLSPPSEGSSGGPPGP